ncbi:hypothetical protein scyTo_0024603 [Scyliorhinus torazame]|uniref:Uncharacterized protein n=1 Tax=Scyliorhinus torazame TaxID=75743 RepID=A0A401QFP5_SCYTO|nr:hypothetical protein [Scyliorhinus torazame]
MFCRHRLHLKSWRMLYRSRHLMLRSLGARRVQVLLVHRDVQLPELLRSRSIEQSQLPCGMKQQRLLLQLEVCRLHGWWLLLLDVGLRGQLVLLSGRMALGLHECLVLPRGSDDGLVLGLRQLLVGLSLAQGLWLLIRGMRLGQQLGLGLWRLLIQRLGLAQLLGLSLILLGLSLGLLLVLLEQAWTLKLLGQRRLLIGVKLTLGRRRLEVLFGLLILLGRGLDWRRMLIELRRGLGTLLILWSRLLLLHLCRGARHRLLQLLQGCRLMLERQLVRRVSGLGELQPWLKLRGAVRRLLPRFLGVHRVMEGCVEEQLLLRVLRDGPDLRRRLLHHVVQRLWLHRWHLMGDLDRRVTHWQ